MIDGNLIVRRLLKYYGFTKDADLVRLWGVAKSSISVWRNKTGPKLDVLTDKCPELSLDWLVYGDGEPLRANRATVSANSADNNAVVNRAPHNGDGETVKVLKEQLKTKDEQINQLLEIIKTMQK